MGGVQRDQLVQIARVEIVVADIGDVGLSGEASRQNPTHTMPDDIGLGRGNPTSAQFLHRTSDGDCGLNPIDRIPGRVGPPVVPFMHDELRQ